MDNYPDHLAPEFEEGGGVLTPFEDWWLIAQGHFGHVPEQVARDWLHRHWSHSPFGWLPSAQYQFRHVQWPSDQVAGIRTGWNNFKTEAADVIAHGRFLAIEHRRRSGYVLADYMVEHGSFPVPPVIIDNRDGHLVQVPGAPFPYPSGFLLVEGHRRFNIAAFLATQQQLQPTVPFWLMERDVAGTAP